MEILPKEMTDKTETDKVNLRVSSGHDPFALTFGTPRYTGFAVKLPSKAFEIPDKSLLIFQWWQGVRPMADRFASPSRVRRPRS